MALRHRSETPMPGQRELCLVEAGAEDEQVGEGLVVDFQREMLAAA